MLPKRLERKIIYKSSWINLYIDKVLMPSGKIVEKYHFLDYQKEAVVVLLTDPNNRICFIQNLRYTTQRIDWELPSGGVEKDENILKSAEREVLEETGFKAENLKLFYTFNPSNGMSNQVVHIITAQVNDLTQQDFDTDEVEEVYWLSRKEVQELIKNKEMVDGVSLITILFYLNDML